MTELGEAKYSPKDLSIRSFAAALRSKYLAITEANVSPRCATGKPGKIIFFSPLEFGYIATEEDRLRYEECAELD